MTIYRTHIQQRRYENKLYVLETIADLDEAIDLLCEELGEDGEKDTFAEDLCPYFGILWPASEALSQYLVSHPLLVQKKKVLELGCGLGLPSLVAANLEAEILATDYHPDVETYFHRNCRHSNLPKIPYQRFNWRDSIEEIGKFDVVMGSDILYESKHPKEVASGLIRFLKTDGIILLADPGRNYLNVFLQAMEEAGFGFESESILINDKEMKIYCFRESLFESQHHSSQ